MDRPISCTGSEVRAILEGRQTQIRRVAKLPPAPNHLGEWQAASLGGPGCYLDRERTVPAPVMPCLTHTRTGRTVRCPYGQPADGLWVRETWMIQGADCRELLMRSGVIPPELLYRADREVPGFKWRPSTHMPRWASRLTLEVVSVRAERLQEISEGDAEAEGAVSTLWATDQHACAYDEYLPITTYKAGFSHLWDATNGKAYPWASNPWVWRLEFRKVAP